MKTPRFWQSKSLLSYALIPLAWLYRIGAWYDRTRTTPQRATLPVISIGNVTAGGAGKTPTTLALIPLLRTLGYTPHILTRGYRGAGDLCAHLVTATDSPQQVGDEALLLAQAAPTWVGRRRLASAQAAAQAGADIVLCDDVLQHHALHKDLSLLVVDGPYGLGNGRILPAGPLREPLAEALKRCDAMVLIGEDLQGMAHRSPIPVLRVSLQPVGDVAFLRAGTWLAFAGIGRPEKFYASLRALGANLVATRDFADHHAYSTADMAALHAQAATLGAQLITTAKDAVKLPAAMRENIAVLPVTLQWDNQVEVIEFLRARCGKSG